MTYCSIFPCRDISKEYPKCEKIMKIFLFIFINKAFPTDDIQVKRKEAQLIKHEASF